MICSPWAFKMDSLTRRILGNRYKVNVTNNNSFEITWNDIKLLSVETIHDLESHWREEIKKAILKIVEDDIIIKLKSEKFK